MGLFDSVKMNNLGSKAYRLHVQGNQALKKGDIKTFQENHAKAMQMYTESYNMGNRTPQYMLAYTILLLRAGEVQKAKEVLLEINKDPKLPKAQKNELRMNYAICQWKQGNLDTAIETLRRAENSGGKTSQIYTILGMILIDKARQTGDFAEATAYNEEAMDYDDEDAATLDNMGYLNYAMMKADLAEGKAEEAAAHRATALDYYRKAGQRDPRQVTTSYMLAKLAFDDGDMDTARKYVLQAEKNRFSDICPVTMEQILALKQKID